MQNPYHNGMQMVIDRFDAVTKVAGGKCPTCHRPFRTQIKARSGDQPGLEKKAYKELKDASNNCKRVYDFLRWELHMALKRSHRSGYTLNDGWCSASDFRENLGEGDWQRRVRQLSEEFGVKIDRKMDYPNGGKRKVAFYRLGEEYNEQKS